jgi:hypothetical protein
LHKRRSSIVGIKQSGEWGRTGALGGGKLLSGNDLHFLTQNGTRIALGNGVNSETNPVHFKGLPMTAKPSAVLLGSSEVQAMRHRLHELANVFTGVMIAGGLLSQYLQGGALLPYASDICESSERGCVLVRELRSQLLYACGEQEADKSGNAIEPEQGNPESS